MKTTCRPSPTLVSGLCLLPAAFCFLLPPHCIAEIIDRIAVSVGNQVITEDQVTEEVRVTAFLNREKLDLSPAAKKKAAERLIEQTLIKRELEVGGYQLPEMSDADELLKAAKAPFATQARFEQELKASAITEDDLKRHLWWQLAVLRFIDFRFRPGIQISDADLKAYYEKESGKLDKQGVKPTPSFEDSRDKIEQILTEQRVDQALDRWLGDTRTRVDIRYREGALQ